MVLRDNWLPPTQETVMARKTTRKPLTEAEKTERQEALQAIHEELERKFAALTTSEEWIEALNFASKFYRYSFGNVLWLQYQALEREVAISHIASFNAWKKLDRSVRKGETSFRVLAPCRYKITDEKTGEDRWIVKGFKTVPVFDISQTDGEDVPDVAPVLLTEGGELGVLAQVEGLITAQGFATSYVPADELGGANGRTNHETKLVHVRNDVEVAQRIKTAVHELAHVLLHAPGQVDYSANRGRCEVEAESVAYVVLTHLGISADDYSLPYVAGWSGGEVKAIRATAETVIKTARTIIDALTGEHAEDEVAA
jgi:antirestriction protein ArdC